MRTALCLAAALVAQSANAASITVAPQDQPPNTLAIQPVFVDKYLSSWWVKSPTGPNPIQHDGWQWIDIYKTNPGQSPAIWALPMFYIDRTEAQFKWRPNSWPEQIHARVDVREFVALGDTSLVMHVDSKVAYDYPDGAIETITWVSPSLGTVTRTYLRMPLDGDFDGSGEVNGADFLTWQRKRWVGELATWQEEFGSGAYSTAGAIPEPSGLTLAAIGVLALRRLHRRLPCGSPATA